jgi:hypothetical protein
MSDSEEDEYNNTGIVYDSENSEDDFDSEDEEVVRVASDLSSLPNYISSFKLVLNTCRSLCIDLTLIFKIFKQFYPF